MSYLNNGTRASALTINGADYTSSLLEFTVSDASAYKNGCLVSSGQMTLGSIPGGYDITDYDRDAFKRGAVVLLDIVDPAGNVTRHPRGYMYVMSTNYNVEEEELTIDLGCRLALISLTEDIAYLESLCPVPLNQAQKSFSNVSAAFSAVGKFVYQDNTGELVVSQYFDPATAGSKWLSILGTTTTSVSPLAGFESIPDGINLSYQVPTPGTGEGGQGYIDTVIDSSTYFTAFPAPLYVRNQRPDTDLSEVEIESGTTTPGSSGCGNTPPPPGNNTETVETAVACTELFDATQKTEYIPATRTIETNTYYNGPGAQVSLVESKTTGMPLEANQQYYADKFAYCRAVYASACNPNGQCPMNGTGSQVVAKATTVNVYGNANELIQSTTDTYALKLSAAQPFNWRAGNDNGVPILFDQGLDTTSLFRASRVVTSYTQNGSSNIQLTETWTSIASRQTGSKGVNLDALAGIKTTSKRISTTTATLEVAPDRLGSVAASTEERSTVLLLGTKTYQKPPVEAGPYYLDEQIPVPLLFANESQINASVDVYSQYIVGFTKGDIYGIQVGETIRPEVAAQWTPNMSFRYYDPSSGIVLALRMDQTAWGVTKEECAFVTSGIWIGVSNGTIVIPENVVGNSLPDMSGGGGGTPAPAPVPPSIDNETDLNTGVYEVIVNVDIYFSPFYVTPGYDSVLPPPPAPENVNMDTAFAAYVTGLIATEGSVLSADPNGSIPLDSGQGQLIVVGGTIVNDNLFA